MLWKVLGWLIALPFIGVGIFIIGRLTMCGPDKEVVKIATPMVEKIADYIVENGVSKSLMEISDLPYQIEECSKKEHYYKDNYTIVENKNNAEWMELRIYCNFYYNKNYKINIRLMRNIDKLDWDGKIEVSSAKTYVSTGIQTDDNGKIYRGHVGEKAIHHSGFCAPLNQ